VVTLDDILDIVEDKGLGYAVQNYYDNEQVQWEDEELKEIWLKASFFLNKLEKMLYELE